MFNLSNETDYKLLSKTKNYYNFFILVILSLFIAISIRLVFLSFDNSNKSLSNLRDANLTALPTIYDVNKNRLAYSDYNYSIKNTKNKVKYLERDVLFDIERNTAKIRDSVLPNSSMKPFL